MRIALTAIFTTLLLSGCGQSEQAAPETVEAEKTSATDVYIQIRQLAAAGDIAEAAKLTDDPDSYNMQMTVARERMGEEVFAQNMKDAALRANIKSEKSAGDFAMVMVKFSVKGKSDMAANFFRKKGDGYVELVTPDDSVPCKLVREFYVAKGEPDAAIGSCSDLPET